MSMKEEVESIMTTGFNVKNVPMKFMIEFKEDAINNFNNSYVLKIVANHFNAKGLNPVINELNYLVKSIDERLNILESKLEDFKTSEKESEKFPQGIIKSFGAGRRGIKNE